MVNFKEVYKEAQQHAVLSVIVMFVILAILIVALSFFSAFTVLAVLISIGFLILSFVRPLWTLAILTIYLPFEPFLLKFTSDEIFIFARFFSEILIYVLAAVTIYRIFTGKARTRPTPINLPITLFIVVLASSAVINLVEPSVAILGMRQILRFVIVFFIVAYLFPNTKFIKHLTAGLLIVVIIQSLLGISQAVIGAPMDELLLPSEARTFGDITITSGTIQFWDSGSRVFGTLGRYDRLGGFLYFFLLIGAGFLYETRFKDYKKDLALVFMLGLPTLVLTFSRSSWFAFLFGFLLIAIYLKRDKRVVLALGGCAIALISYLVVSGINVRFITEIPGQTLAERFYETFSYSRWRGEYYGLGRTYWFVHTPLTVLPASPLFGFGPGQFGGGVVSALSNTTVYDKLGLPFGVYGTEGYIDNSWFSLLGEVGLIGMAFFLWMYVAIFRYSVQLYRRGRDAFPRALALGFSGVMIGAAFNAFTVTLFEIRTFAYYLWLFAGFVFVLGERSKRKRS